MLTNLIILPTELLSSVDKTSHSNALLFHGCVKHTALTPTLIKRLPFTVTFRIWGKNLASTLWEITACDLGVFLPAAKPAGQWMTISLRVALSDLRYYRGKIDTGALVIEVTDSKSEVRCDLRVR